MMWLVDSKFKYIESLFTNHINARTFNIFFGNETFWQNLQNDAPNESIEHQNITISF